MVSYIKNRIIHRFVRDISDYEEGGSQFGQILPADTQVYAVYPEEFSSDNPREDGKYGLYYVIGDGVHTYTEIRDGHGNSPYNIEYIAVPANALGGIINFLGKIQIHNLKNGDYLVYNKEKDAWVNYGGTPIPPDPPIPLGDLDGGPADQEVTEWANGGNAGTTEWELIIDGGHAGIWPDMVDGGQIVDTFTDGIDGGNIIDFFDNILDGGVVQAETIIDGGGANTVATSTLDGGTASSIYDENATNQDALSVLI